MRHILTVQERKAIAVLFGAARGNVSFVQSGEVVKMSGVIEGLTPGLHGFHIHEKGDVSMGCASTLGHYNPFGVSTRADLYLLVLPTGEEQVRDGCLSHVAPVCLCHNHYQTLIQYSR